MEKLTGVLGDIRVGRAVTSICLNSGIGEGNCSGMIKHKTCPAVRLGSEHGKFPGCQDFISRNNNCGQCSREK